MVKISKTRKINLLSICILAITITGYIFAYRHILGLYVTLGQVNAELVSMTQTVENKHTTISLLEETKEERKELNNYFVSAQDPTQFLDLIDTVASGVGITSKSEKVEVLPIDETYGKYPEEIQKKVKITLSTQGTWEETYHFIALLESFTYAVSIDNIALTYGTGGEGGPWSGQIHIHSLAI